MAKYSFTKIINSDKLSKELITAGIAPVNIATNSEGTVVEIYYNDDLTEEQVTTLSALVSSHTTVVDPLAPIKAAVYDAQKFGIEIIIEFVAGNVALGITQAGMTGTVLSRTLTIGEALKSGSLYVAMDLINAFPEEHKDATFLTNARLLAILNKIETKLGLALSTQLGE